MWRLRTKIRKRKCADSRQFRCRQIDSLINAVFGRDTAETGFGTRGVTPKVSPYEDDRVPFRLIDSIGFEPSWFNRQRAIKAVDRWTKEGLLDKDSDHQINAIWLCFDGTAAKVFPETVKAMVHAIGHWNQAPVIVVITKSYSVPDRQENIRIIREAFDAKNVVRIREIIPVVAKTFNLNDVAFAPLEGIDELIDATNKLMPEGIRAAEATIHQLKHHRKQWESRVVELSAAGGAFGVGFGMAKKMKVPAHKVLLPAESVMVMRIAKIYEIDDEHAGYVKDKILLEITKNAIAQFLEEATKNIVDMRFKNARKIIDGVVAAAIVVLIGEQAINVFDQVYQGKKSIDEQDCDEQQIDATVATPAFISMVSDVAQDAINGLSAQDVAKSIMNFFGKSDHTDTSNQTAKVQQPHKRQ